MRHSTTPSAERLKRFNAIVLAGGQSRRLKSDKVQLQLANGRVLANLIDLCRGLFGSVILVVDRVGRVAHAYRSLPGVRVVSDEIPGAGPLGGILTGLHASSSNMSFITACDLPFLSGDLIRFVASRISDQDVLVPGCGDAIEPLVGFYAKRCSEIIRCSIERGDLRVRGFWPAVKTDIIELSGVFDEMDLRTWLLNVNTRHDLHIAEAVASSESWK